MNTAIRTIKLLQIKVKLCGDKIPARFKNTPQIWVPGMCFGFWSVFLHSTKCFGFWSVYWFIGSVLSLPATVVDVFLLM